MEIKYTNKEKKQIKRAFHNVLDDLDELWKLCESKEINIHIHLDNANKINNNYPNWDWSLLLNDNGIYFLNTFRISNLIKVTLEERLPFGMKRRTNNYLLMVMLLKEYESIRPKIKTEIEESRSRKEAELNLFEELEQKYAKEATVEIDIPATMNKHGIEVLEENGKAIGEIKLGNGTLRIITRGTILLEKETKQPVKEKKLV